MLEEDYGLAAVPTQRLLITSCSQRKRRDPHLLPAMERYDGPAFRVIRRYLRFRSTSRLDTVILSARFGLVDGSTAIPWYDERMTLARAKELHDEVCVSLARLFDSVAYTDVLFALGREYQAALQGWEALIPEATNVTVASGGIGAKLAELHGWLYGTSPADVRQTVQGPRTIRGIEVSLSACQALEIARRALTDGRLYPHFDRIWYVSLGDQRVDAKSFVSLITGLPVSKFSTTDARRVLEGIGITLVRQGVIEKEHTAGSKVANTMPPK